MNRYFGTPAGEGENEWLSISDMMSGLMVVFLFVSIFFIQSISEENRQIEQQKEQIEQQKEQALRQATTLQERERQLYELNRQIEQQNQRIASIAIVWQTREQDIYRALQEEFGDDLPRWNAEIVAETLLIRFKAPEVLFEAGKATIRPLFAAILSDFFPRYVRVLKPFSTDLGELRIEGHTSSEWESATPEQAYIENMRLSQDRTRAVLEFVLGLDTLTNERDWLQRLLTANGLSSSRLVDTSGVAVVDSGGIEDAEKSRRVEFRVRTRTRAEILRILEETSHEHHKAE